MLNQPIEEKWKIDFRKEFPSFLTDNHNGKIVPIYNGWWVFVQGYKRRNLPQDIEDFIENLLEQERKRLAKRIIKDDVTCPEAIMIFLDEQAELLDTHTENETKAHKPNNCTCPCHNKHDNHYPL